MKTYKGYELYKMIATGEIKEGTEFIDNNGKKWIYERCNFRTDGTIYDDITFSIMEFEVTGDVKINENSKAVEKILNDLFSRENYVLTNMRIERTYTNGKEEGYQQAMLDARKIVREYIEKYIAESEDK